MRTLAWVLSGLCFALGGLPLADALAATAAESGGAPGRPNVVVILTDDMGYSDIGCFGSEIATPNIDSLARDGVAFTQFYNFARCCPTRGALLTGRYPHQVGLGAMIDFYDWQAGPRDAANSPAYQKCLRMDCSTVADLLRDAGYATYLSGKWHLGHNPNEWPFHRGFDHTFSQIRGAMNYFGGSSTGPRDLMSQDGQQYTPPMDGFYTTDAFTDHALGYIDEAAKAKKPFFLYLAYNTAHWPFHAPEADIAKYAGKYDQGFEPTRQARLAKLIDRGILPKGFQMSPLDLGNVKPWVELTPERKKVWTRRMEVYAAMIDHMDGQIGRVLHKLDDLDESKNTVVIYLHDNGATPEDPNRGDLTKPVGTRDTFVGYGYAWGNVSNTPWRYHKLRTWEGGISTPCLVRWPAGIPQSQNGRYIRNPANVIDIVPTVLEATGAKQPAKSGDVPLEGHSLTRLLRGERDDTVRTFYWEHESNRGVRDGPWKLCSMTDNENDWNLFDMEHDRVECHNLIAEQPEVAKQLKAKYQAWADRVGVIPWSELQRRWEEKKKQEKQ